MLLYHTLLYQSTKPEYGGTIYHTTKGSNINSPVGYVSYMYEVVITCTWKYTLKYIYIYLVYMLLYSRRYASVVRMRMGQVTKAELVMYVFILSTDHARRIYWFVTLGDDVVLMQQAGCCCMVSYQVQQCVSSLTAVIRSTPKFVGGMYDMTGCMIHS